MGVDAWITLAVVAVTVVVLARELVSAPVAVVGAVTVLLVADVIEVEDALSGFSNPAPMTVAALYVLAAAAETTGSLEIITERILKRVPPGSAGDKRAMRRILLPVATASAFLNNTTIVAMAAPGVGAWARRTGRAPSSYLMPISFAAILGGMTTLIGTSTNLVVSGLLEDAGRRPLGLFEIGAAGLPVAVVGLILLTGSAFKLLPVRRDPGQDFRAGAREFTVEMLVAPGSPLAGRTIQEANLRNLQGVFLVEIERDGRPMAPVAPHEVLSIGDRLTFAGNVERVVDLHKMPGLVSAEHRHFGTGQRPQQVLYEAVVAEGSPLVDSTLKAARFRGGYGGAVLAIHRAGARIPAKLGEIPLRAGDVLLVLADRGFKKRWSDRRDFLVIAPLGGDTPPRTEKAPLVGVVTAALLITVGTGLFDILEAALLAAFLLVVTRVVSANEARNAIDLNVIVVIAASFGLGAAMSVSGLADQIARVVIEPLSALGDVGLLAGIFVATVVLTEMITNNAAAILVFPIALATAAEAGLDVRPLAVAIALGASASFLTPIGYQTNMMVYGIGGYRFGDFARLGAPLSIVVAAVAIAIIPLIWPLR